MSDVKVFDAAAAAKAEQETPEIFRQYVLPAMSEDDKTALAEYKSDSVRRDGEAALLKTGMVGKDDSDGAALVYDAMVTLALALQGVGVEKDSGTEGGWKGFSNRYGVPVPGGSLKIVLTTSEISRRK